MSTLKNKISIRVPNSLPDFVSADHLTFVDFVTTYYEFLESVELKLVNLGSKDAILQEEGSTNLVNLEDPNIYRQNQSNNILLEDTEFGSFVNDEVIIGQTSKATATVRVEDINLGSRLFITPQNRFILGEQIVGQTSNASAYIGDYTANPVQSVQQLLDYADVDETVDSFFKQFKESFMKTVPKKLAPGLNQKTLLKNIKDLYRAKGSKKGMELFFRILLNEEVEIVYPTKDIFRMSDGQWSEDKVFYVIQSNDSITTESSHLDVEGFLLFEDGSQILAEDTQDGTADFSKLVGQRITQASSPPATALVDTIFQYNFGGEYVTEFVLQEASIDGTFIPGYTVRGFSNVDQITEIEAKIIPVVKDAGLNLSDFQSSQYFEITDQIAVTSNTGDFASAKISNISAGRVEEIVVDSGGTGYEGGETVLVNNVGTGGSGLTAQISVVNGGFLPEDGTLSGNFRVTLEDDSGELELETSEMTYETPTGIFNIGETITGSSSNATGTVVEISLDTKTIHYVKVGVPSFVTGEILRGTTTNYTSKVVVNTETLHLTNEEDLGFVSDDRIELEPHTIYADPFSGKAMVQELGTDVGDITDVRVLSLGYGYTSLPSLTVDVGTGSNGTVLAKGNGVGLINGVQIIQHGSHYTDEDVSFNTSSNILCTNLSGIFTSSEPVTGLTSGATGVFVKSISNANIFKIRFTSTKSFEIGETIRGDTSGRTAVVNSYVRTNLPGSTGTLITKTGRYVSDKGFISESTKKIQDSYYYQDFSYVVKASRSIVQWRDELLASVHPAGWAVFGQVDIANKLKATASISSRVGLGALLAVIFANLIGRRLGTTDQVPLNPTPMAQSTEPSGEPYYATRLEVSGSGTFSSGDTITGSSSNATGTVIRDLVDDSGQRTVTYRPATGIFTTADTITGAPSGTTATVMNVYGLRGERDVTLNHVMHINIHTHRTADNGFFYSFGPNYFDAEQWKFADSQLNSSSDVDPLGNQWTFRGHPVYRFLMPITNLTNNISNITETFIIDSTTGFPSVGTVLIGDEYMDYISAVGGVLDCSGAGTRAALNSTAAPHSAADQIYVVQWVPKQDTTTGYRIKDWVKDQYGQDITLDNLINHSEYKNNITPPSEVMIYKS